MASNRRRESLRGTVRTAATHGGIPPLGTREGGHGISVKIKSCGLRRSLICSWVNERVWEVLNRRRRQGLWLVRGLHSHCLEPLSPLFRRFLHWSRKLVGNKIPAKWKREMELKATHAVRDLRNPINKHVCYMYS